MWDFLTFHTFITDKVLIILYYILAIALPLFIWGLRRYLEEKVKFLKSVHSAKIAFAVLFLAIIAELILRVMFEFAIAYFDMHDYLHIIKTHMESV